MQPAATDLQKTAFNNIMQIKMCKYEHVPELVLISGLFTFLIVKIKRDGDTYLRGQKIASITEAGVVLVRAHGFTPH